MALPNGDLITTVFDPQMAYPVDKRMQVDTLNSRDSISMFIRWEGMTVYVLEDSKIYILQGGRSNEFWNELGTGSGTGGTTFVGQFATADLLPTTGRSAGDYAFVGTGDDFVQYNWDNIANQWVMAEGQTDMASEFFHIGYKTPLRRPVIFPLLPKDVIVQESGDFVFAPETAVARFIFTGEVAAIRGIETASADREIKLVNRTGSDIPLRDKTSGIPTGSGFDFGGTDYTWVNGSEITLKGNGTYWELAPNNQIAFSDHLDSVNASINVGKDGLRVITGVNDTFSGEIVSFKEIDYTPDIIDGVVFTTINGINVKRFVESINYTMFGAKGDGINDDAAQIKLAHQVANILNLPVINEEGEYWLNNPNNIPIRTNVNWGKTVFHIDESKHSNVNKWFIVERSEEPIDVTLTSGEKTSFLSKFKEGVSQITELASHKNRYLIVRDDNDVKGRNGGSGVGEPKLEVFKVAEKGIIVGDILAQFTNYTSFKSYKIEKNYLTIDGGSFLFNNQNNPAMAGNYIYSGFDCRRTKVIFRNQDLAIEGGADPIVMSYYDIGFYYFSQTCDVYLENITLLPRRVAGSGTYGIGTRNCMDVHFNNVSSEADEQFWGTMGGVHIKNLFISDCKLNRIDCHDNLINLTIENSDLSLISIIGGGLLRLRNVKVSNQSLVVFRQDYGSVWDGDIDIDNCRQAFSSTPASVVGILSFYPDPTFDYKRKVIFGRSIKVRNVSILYSTENTVQHLVMRLPSRGQNTTTGYRFYLPTQLDCRNIDVNGRGLGIILMQLDVPSDWRTEKKSDFSNGVITPNSFLSFKNVDADVNKTNQDTIIFGSAFSVVDENTFIPQIDVDNCGEISLQFRDSILKATVNRSKIGSLRTVTTGWRGEAVFNECVVKPRGRMIVDLEDNHITWVNTKFDVPYLLDTDTPISTTTEWNSRYEFNMTLNSYLAGSHVNSSFTYNSLLFFNGLSVIILPEFLDKMFLSNGKKTPYMTRRSGTTAQRPPSDRINTNYTYFDTTIDAPIVWDGTNWRSYSAPDATETVKGIAELSTQDEVDAGVNDVTIVTPRKLASSSRIVKMHGTNLSTSNGTDLIGPLVTGAITTVFNNNTGTGWPTANGDARTFHGPALERTWSLYKDRDTNRLFIQRYSTTGVGQGWVEVTSPNASTTQRGIIEQATDEEIKTGTDTERAVDPKGLKDNYTSYSDRTITSSGTIAITPLTYNVRQETIIFTGTAPITLNGFNDAVSNRNLILVNQTGGTITIPASAGVSVPFAASTTIGDGEVSRFMVYNNLILKEV